MDNIKNITNLMKYIENFDEDFNLSDFTTQELDELLNANKTDIEKFKMDYFSKYNDVKSNSLKKQDW